MLIIYRNGYVFQVDPQQPFVRFKEIFTGAAKKKAPAPTPTAPAPTPQAVDEEATAKERDKRRQRIAAAGRGGTILTQGRPLGQSGSATILGRSTA